MGGGTGTGAGGVIARVAKDLGALTVAVVTKPFQFEGTRRLRAAEAGIEELKKYVDTLIVIPNQNLFRIANEKTTFAEAFVLADQVLYSGVACIVDVIVKEGLINLDLADVRTVLSGMGTAMIGTGEASGERRAVVAAEEAISNPLLDDVSLKGAKGLLLSILGGRDLTLYEVDEAASRVRQEVDPDANIIVGATFDESLGGRIRVSIVAAGMSRKDAARFGPGFAHAAFGPGGQGDVRQTSRPAAAPPSPYPSELSAAAQMRSAAGKSVDFMGPLSRAIQQGPRLGQARSGRKPGAAWRGPGNVVIEEGPPFGQEPAPTNPPPQWSHDAPQRSETFSPAPPVTIPRTGPRMPTVEDFPAIAQREYRAKIGALANQGTPTAPSPAHAPPPPQPRKRGLFERITGLGRRGDQEEPANHASYPQPTAAASEQAPPAAEGGLPRAGAEDAAPPLSPSREEADLPRFFYQKSKG
jgi:cell division protein FtsZ